MKTPTAKKLPSGSWFVRVRVNGEDIGITRATEKAAIAEAMAVKAGFKREAQRQTSDRSIREAIDAYIEKRQDKLSPATVRGYRIIQKNRFPGIMDVPERRLTDSAIRAELHRAAAELSPKTLRNSWGFVSSVLAAEFGRKVTDVYLPQVVVSPHAFLEPEDIPRFLEAARGSRHELPILLALHSLRFSEIAALRWQDIDVGRKQILVRGAAVPDEQNRLVRKAANKNASSRRTVPIMIDRLPELVAEADRSGEFVTSVKNGSLFNHINRICRKNDLPEVGVHGLRHSFVSLAFSLGVPEELTMQIGGWSDYQTMRKIYKHLAQKDITKHVADLTAFFNRPKNGNENGNE